MRYRRRSLIVALIACLGLLAAPGKAFAWQVPNGHPVAVNGTFPFPDPAAAGYGAGGVQLFSTASSGYNIPTENWTTPGGSATNGAADALPILPGDIQPGGSWAPAVAYIQNQYVLWFVGVQTSGSGAYLETAYSQNPAGPYTVAYRYYNGGNTAYGLLDPYLWQDSGGDWWVFWAVEHGTDTAPNEVYSARLSANGLQFAPGAAANALVSYGSMDGAVDPGSPRGNNPQIENPAFVTDPQGTYNYNMTMSFGSYNLIGSYRSINVACDGPAGNCGWNTTKLNNFDSQVRRGSSIGNSGGASYVLSSPQYAEQFMPFAAVPPGDSNYLDRQSYSDNTNSIARRSPDIPVRRRG